MINLFVCFSLKPDETTINRYVRYLVGYLLSVTLMKAPLTSLFSDRWRIIKEGRNRGGLTTMFGYGDFVIDLFV
jgi:hypothetical protein